MGFSGSFIIARSDRPLMELASLQASGIKPVRCARDGQWQILEASPGGDPDPSIVAETGAPVLVAHVVFSDFAAVEAHGPSGVSWRCAMPAVVAREYEFPEEWIGVPADVTRQAVRWAGEAGQRPDPPAVRAVLSVAEHGEAEGLVHDLAHALGFQFRDEALPDPS